MEVFRRAAFCAGNPRLSLSYSVDTSCSKDAVSSGFESSSDIETLSAFVQPTDTSGKIPRLSLVMLDKFCFDLVELSRIRQVKSPPMSRLNFVDDSTVASTTMLYGWIRQSFEFTDTGFYVHKTKVNEVFLRKSEDRVSGKITHT